MAVLFYGVRKAVRRVAERGKVRVYCADIGGSFIRLGAESDDGVSELAAVATPAASWPAFAAALAALLRGRDAQAPLAIAIAGLVDTQTGSVAAANIPCLAGHVVAAELEAALRRRVLLANDADCFALAEARAGVGQGHAVVFGVILGTGVGGGLVVQGRLLPEVSGEWGHGPIARAQAGTPPATVPRWPCGCGRTGCMDTVGGARGLERLDALLHGGDRTSRAIVAAWQEGEAAAARTLDVYLDLLSEPLALLINTLGAGIVPVGGGLGAVAALVAALDARVRPLVLHAGDAPLLVPGTLGARAGLIGAAALA